MWRSSAFVASTAVVLFACTATPPMAPDYSLPLKAIILHATCELRDALASFENTPSDIRLPPDFPHHWSMSIQLTPKVSTDFNARIGMTGTTRFPGSTRNHFNTFSLGSSPGAGVDVKTWKNGAVTYYVSGNDLLNRNIAINCTGARETPHALAQDFGIHDWLSRLVASANQSELKGVVEFDKPTLVLN